MVPSQAFTLIEVLVALAIFAISGLVLASAYVNVLASEHAALRRDELAPYHRLVREALYSEPDRTKVETWNELPLPDDWTAHWRATLAPTALADLFDVTLEVELTNARGQKLPTYVETFRLLRPTWSQPADRETLRANARSRLAQRTYQ
jgi:general secretion pathway protein I